LARKNQNENKRPLPTMPYDTGLEKYPTCILDEPKALTTRLISSVNTTPVPQIGFCGK